MAGGMNTGRTLPQERPQEVEWTGGSFFPNISVAWRYCYDKWHAIRQISTDSLCAP